MASNGFDFWILLTVAVGILAIFVLFIITILFVYQRKTFEHQKKVTAIEQTLKQEVLKTQIEVQDQTLTYISREIHDNITQVLSFVKLSLGVKSDDLIKTQTKIDESRELLSRTINDLRDLSKSMSFDTIKALGITDTIRFEVERLNKSSLIAAAFKVEGEIYPLDEKRELVIFRIFQECVNNALKHAGATQINIALLYSPQMFNLTITDNGNGFLMSMLDGHRGSGLRNLQNRGTLIGADVTIDSSPGNGCRITVQLNPAVNKLYDESSVSNSIS